MYDSYKIISFVTNNVWCPHSKKNSCNAINKYTFSFRNQSSVDYMVRRVYSVYIDRFRVYREVYNVYRL